ncbi:hypothetical protein GCM10011366_10960 [Ornithinimicrobium tianjinense]|uniref:Uncharacterized protein n=1 Tax=Ornithinimicrobium tianjinense TaxID=1195761 RepID=A0A917BHR0_9MICO|nr:hypothetical protein GCM10011366_10960 [Ornithinimicrobium tianjinense]
MGGVTDSMQIDSPPAMQLLASVTMMSTFIVLYGPLQHLTEVGAAVKTGMQLAPARAAGAVAAITGTLQAAPFTRVRRLGVRVLLV